MLFAKLTENKKRSKSKSSSNICSKYRKIEDRLSNYYCKRCGKEFPGSSALRAYPKIIPLYTIIQQAKQTSAR
jgi:transposase-like protein